MLVYLALRYLVRTPFGLALQGVRDDPIRMGSLGYNVAVHRTVAFGVAGFVAALGGVLFVWWNGHIDPASINIGATIDLLVICVIGGLYRLEGAWVGAIAFVVIQNYVRTDDLPVVGGTFHTLIGVALPPHRARLAGRTDGDLGLAHAAVDTASARRSGNRERRPAPEAEHCRQDRRVKGGRDTPTLQEATPRIGVG